MNENLSDSQMNEACAVGLGWTFAEFAKVRFWHRPDCPYTKSRDSNIANHCDGFCPSPSTNPPNFLTSESANAMLLEHIKRAGWFYSSEWHPDSKHSCHIWTPEVDQDFHSELQESDLRARVLVFLAWKGKL